MLHIDRGFPPLPPEIPVLYGNKDDEVQKFLEKEVPEIDAQLIRIIEWRPSLNFYGKEYVKLFSHVTVFLKRAEAGRRTTAVFGRRWVRNFFRNLNLINQTLLYKQADVPVIVTGSGPGLETTLPVIQKLRDSCLVIAASSSTMALLNAGISPDLTASADGGSWAPRHLYPFYRHTSEKAGFLAANLCAALPSQCACTPKLLINDGSFWQSIVLHELGIPSVIIPQKGTVTAYAVELAMILSRGNIYLAGMDLSVRDIRTHVRPYAFDHLFYSRACRFTPVYSESFVRSNLIREGGSMDIYAAWFKNQLASWPKRIFSLGGSHEVFEASLPKEKAAFNKKREFFKTVSIKEEPSLLCKRGVSVLLAALKDGGYADKLKQELVPLLFPGEKNAAEQELETEIKKLAGCYAEESFE